jgi:bis(5'-nucleosidyl)-tetraphosphatase
MSAILKHMKLPVFKPLYLILKAFGLPVEWEVSVGSCIFRETPTGRQYLLLQYPSGHFDFAKGHVEEGETEEETLRRETEEETGINDLVVLKARTSIRYYYVAKGNEKARRIEEGRGIYIFKQVHFYPAETKTSEVKISHEHIGSVWLPYAEAIQKVTFDNARRVIRMTEEDFPAKQQ